MFITPYFGGCKYTNYFLFINIFIKNRWISMRFASPLLLITSALDSASLRADPLSPRVDSLSLRADPPSSRADSLLLRADSLSLRVNLYHPDGFSISPSTPIVPCGFAHPVNISADYAGETTEATSLTKFFTILCEAMREKQQNTPKRHQLDNISSNSLWSSM